MKYENLGVIPVLTSQAGSCATGANWQEAGVRAASFDLTALLMKPGFDFLKILPDLAVYEGWHDTLILNASLLKMGSDGRYALRSHYDGGCSYYSVEDILTLIAKLQPNIVILPEGLSQFWITLPKTILPFVPVTDLPNCSEIERPFGVYITYDKASSSSSALFQQLDRHKDVLCYVAGDISLPLMIDLIGRGISLIESDIPASDACAGNVYCQEGVVSLQAKESATRFEVIDRNCKCPVCSQNFTQAYLHHLLEHTPLLCQRYLVQHNLYYCQAAIRAALNYLCEF